MTTTLALYDTGAILGDLMKTHDATTCDVCHTKLVAKETYSICRFPDAPPNTRGLPEEHLGSGVGDGAHPRHWVRVPELP